MDASFQKFTLFEAIINFFVQGIHFSYDIYCCWYWCWGVLSMSCVVLCYWGLNYCMLYGSNSKYWDLSSSGGGGDSLVVVALRLRLRSLLRQSERREASDVTVRCYFVGFIWKRFVCRLTVYLFFLLFFLAAGSYKYRTNALLSEGRRTDCLSHWGEHEQPKLKIKS